MLLTIRNLAAIVAVFSAVVSANPVFLKERALASEPNIKYVGRWDSVNANGFWSAPYIRVRFTNTTSLEVKLDCNHSFPHPYTAVWKITSDNTAVGPTVFDINTLGLYQIEPAGGFNPSTVYSLQLGGLTWEDVLQFRGIQLSAGGHTLPQNFPTRLIEFVGDSITAGYNDTLKTWSDYSWVTGETLGAEHVQIATPGVCLGNYSSCSGRAPMISYYFSEKQGRYPLTPWNFKTYTADAVTVMLGENDDDSTVRAPSAYFISTYTSFLANIRGKYPKAHIFALENFSKHYAVETAAAAAARIAAGDRLVTFVNTTGWLGSGDFNNGAGVHPNDVGHRKIASLLAPIMKKILGW